MKVKTALAAPMALFLSAIAPAVVAQDGADDAIYGESGIDESSYDDDVYGDDGADGGGDIDYDAGAAGETSATEYAYQGEERQLEEVVVTVERREQNLQDLGGTATTFNSEELKQYGVVDVTDLQRLVPGLTVARNQSNIEVWIRGVGNSNNTELSDASTAFYLDGIYLPRNWGIGAGEFDMQRVEVLEGPQGTLRGRNALGGSINFIPWRPGLGTFDMAAEASYGNFDQTTFQGMVNAPLGDNAAIRVSGNFLEHDSYFEDVGPLNLGVAEANNNWAVRGQILWEPTENLRFYLTADTLSDEGTGYTGTNFANPLGNGIPLDAIEDPRKVLATGFAPELDIRHWGTKFEVKYDFGWADLQYEFGYRDAARDETIKTPLGPFYPGVFDTLDDPTADFDNFSFANIFDASKSTTHEIRLVSPQDQFAAWTAGLFYFKEEQEIFLGSVGDRSNNFYGAEFNQPDVDTNSRSVYGDVTFNFTPDWRLTTGLRYTKDKKKRRGVIANYGFIFGGRAFENSLGVRLGTEGFSFARGDRTIYNADTNGDGAVDAQEAFAFFDDGVETYGARDNMDEIIAAGPYAPGGSADDPSIQTIPGSPTGAPCIDVRANDGYDCPDGTGISAAYDEEFTYSLFRAESLADGGAAAFFTPQAGSVENSFVDWRIRVEHNWREESLVYASVTTGHRSGGFNDTLPSTIGQVISPTYDEESMVAYEIGTKNDFELFDIPMRFNATAFYYDWQDYQLNATIPLAVACGTTGGCAPPEGASALPVSFTFNAEQVEIYGVQLETVFNLPWELTLSTKALFLEAELKESQDLGDFRFDPERDLPASTPRPINGKRLPRTPEWRLNFTLTQSVGLPWGRLGWHFLASWQSESFMTIFNGEDYRQSSDYPNSADPRFAQFDTTNPGCIVQIGDVGIPAEWTPVNCFDSPERLNDTIPAYWLLGMGINYKHQGLDNVDFEAYVNNLLDETQPTGLFITPDANSRWFTRPRTFGVRVRWRY